MNEPKQSVTNRLEELFLSILRNVILFVLAGSILAAVFFAVAGVSDLGAKPKEYKYEKFDSKQLVIDLKESLQTPQAAAPEAAPDTAKKSVPQASSPLEESISKQTGLLVEFYKKYDFIVNPSWLNEQVKPRLRKQARDFSMVYGEGDSALLEYSNGQTQVLEAVLLSPELNQLLDKKFKAQGDLGPDEKYQVVHEFVNKVLAFYPDFHSAQINQKQEFDSEQQAEVGLRNAGAMMKLYVAGGVFAAFLLISFILVLVKIERNLRAVKLEPVAQE